MGGERASFSEDVVARATRVSHKEAGGTGRVRGAPGWSLPRVFGSTWQLVWAILVATSFLLYSVYFLWWTQPMDGYGRLNSMQQEGGCPSGGREWSGNLRKLDSAWNGLCFGPPPELLRIALFVKKWPVGGVPGGLERHALTLHKVLAGRGHEVHVYTVSGDGTLPEEITQEQLHVHFVKPNAAGNLDIKQAWEKFLEANSSKAFDVVHSESVALPHWRARNISNMAASWHGVAYEVIHSDVVLDLMRKPGEPRSAELQKVLSERLFKVTEEVRFFRGYRHHVATSDYVGDVLQTIYEIPLENVHIILNGVDESKFRPDSTVGVSFREKHGVPLNASLVIGAAGRLVKDKGHPLLFEAFSAIIKDHKDVYLLVAGQGPWGERYKELAPYAKTLGSLTPLQLAEFYNAIDIFVNPTLRAQGLDHTLLEAMQCGKPLLATHFSSIMKSVIVNSDIGYIFAPNVDSLGEALRSVIRDGKDNMKMKGKFCRSYASVMFTATKMGAAYERLFLCMKKDAYCHYPLTTDCKIETNSYITH
ncbi:hypothetical protein O6H91_05G011100 [Diphasiastrum complanatum]|nr:hypothetical protein O6H91_05G011100 [Diphasiastrum complanatum]